MQLRSINVLRKRTTRREREALRQDAERERRKNGVILSVAERRTSNLAGCDSAARSFLDGS